MHKALVIIDQDPVLKEFVNKLTDLSIHREERFDFLKKQADDVDENYKKDSKLIWVQIEKYLIERKLLAEDFDPEKNNLHIDENGVLVFCDGESHRLFPRELSDFFRNL